MTVKNVWKHFQISLGEMGNKRNSSENHCLEDSLVGERKRRQKESDTNFTACSIKLDVLSVTGPLQLVLALPYQAMCIAVFG